MTTNSVTLFAPPMVEAQSNVFVLAGGIVTRFTLIGSRGKEWYETRFMPRLGPTAMIGLLFTIVVMFSMQGDKILAAPLDVLRVAIPLVVYFIVMSFVSFSLSLWRRLPYELAATQSFTVASNNFELAIAVAVGTHHAHLYWQANEHLPPILQSRLALGRSDSAQVGGFILHASTPGAAGPALGRRIGGGWHHRRRTLAAIWSEWNTGGHTCPRGQHCRLLRRPI